MLPRSAKIIVCYRVASCDSGWRRSQQNFYRLQLGLRLRPIQSSPVDSNSGLDSDSAALHTTVPFKDALLRRVAYWALAAFGT